MSPETSGPQPFRKTPPTIVSVGKRVDSQPNFSGESTQREWWAQRWVDVLESFGWRRRLERARNYVREGRVLTLDFEHEKVFAKVQGTADDPYDVSLSLDPFEAEQWGFVIEEMSQRAIFTAKLLAGEMPQNIEEAFTASGLSLFPFSKFDIHSRCSCPDPVNPCKHIGAVYYLLGDYFSQDPFILFQLRGRTKDSILEALRTLRSEAGGSEDEVNRPVTQQTQSIQLDPSYWNYDQPLDPSLVVITPPPTQDTILDVLGPLPIDQLSSKKTNQSQTLNSAFMEYLKDVYQRASQQAMLNAMKNS